MRGENMTDIEIAHQTPIQKIETIAQKINLKKEDLELYGNDKAKIDPEKINSKKQGKLILVTAISPTPYGEGKTTVSIGLNDALCRIGKNAILALREPSLGPVFGMKGGATGGGYSQIIPMEDINLHFTGDFHAITAANNLLCAAIDNHLYFGNELNIDPETITCRRCMDMNDRALRTIQIGLSMEKEIKREEHFNITAASEMMTIFCLASNEEDLKRRINQIVIGYTYEGKEVLAQQLKITGSIMTLLKDAIKPNLVQTLEGNPALVHGGPFANIAHGCNSLIATKLALKLSDFVVTEAGFGSDLGAEKFLDIKCRIGNLRPSVVVLVTTLKSLKYNAGIPKEEILKENVKAIKQGSQNLKAHIENLKKFKIPIVVCLNRYQEDTDLEIKTIKEICTELEVPLEESRTYQEGGLGAISLAQTVISLSEQDNKIEYQYELEDTLTEKIEKLAFHIYHAKTITYSEKAQKKIEQLSKSKYKNYPICVAKTQYSLSDDPKKLGDPREYELHVNDVTLYAGAEFITILLGDIMTMPGFPKKPNYEQIDVTNGTITGLF